MRRLLILFLIISILSTAVRSDCNALYALYNESDNRPYWKNSTGWSTYNPQTFSPTPPLSCCTWTGIVCDPGGSTILSITLPSSNISLPFGLPKSLAVLTSLQALDLGSNAISGTLPESYAALSNVSLLFVEYNHITGTIPESWANMTSLKTLNIGHNDLQGKIPRLSACTMIMCSNIGLNSSMQEVDFDYVAERCAGIWWYLIATGVSGTIPCHAHVKKLELSYSLVSGSIPCCHTLRELGLEGTSVNTWEMCDANITATIGPPVLSSLFLSNSAVRYVPANISTMFPMLTTLTLRNLMLAQEIPVFSPLLTVLDAAGNAFTTPASGQYAMSLNNNFALLDLTSVLSKGMTLGDINFSCAAPYSTFSTDCVLRTTPYRALGREYSAAPIDEAVLLNPMLRLLPSGLLLAHMLYNFISGVSGMFQPTLIVRGSSMTGGSAIMSYVSIPEPSWNNTFLPIAPTPSTIVPFDGLVGSTLLFGVDYRLEVTFLYRPVVLAGTGKIGSAQRRLVIGQVTLPLCNEQLYAVPFTTLCIACPTRGICNGSSLFLAQTNFWRSKPNVLPLFECDTAGCQGVKRLGPECAAGFAGPLCSSCAANYGKSTSGGCIECSSGAWNLSVVVIGAVIFFLAASFASVKSVKVLEADRTEAESGGGAFSGFISERSRMLAATSVKKIQSHMGMYALVGRLALAANHTTESAALQTIQQVASQLSLRSVSFVTCLFPSLNVVSQLQAMLVIVPSLLLANVFIVRIMRKRWAVFTVVSSICVLLYDMSINIALLVIPIDTFNLYDAAQYSVNRTFARPVETISVLSLDRSVQGDSSSTSSWRIVAFIWLGLFGIGLPVLICSVIHRMFVTGRRAEAEVQFAFLTSTYRKKRWYWEQVIVLRKFALAVVVVGLKPYPLAQAQGLLVVLMAYLIFMEWQAPFATSAMRNAERTTCVGAIIIVNTVMATSSSSSSSVADVTGNAALSVVNASIQYAALTMLVAFLVLEWVRRANPDEQDEAILNSQSTLSMQKENVVTDDAIPLADLMSSADFSNGSFSPSSGGGRTRSFSLNRVRSSPMMRKRNSPSHSEEQQRTQKYESGGLFEDL